ncbi:terpene synthase 10-like [Phoenix dactylifera]|uniref:Terpene synthase 10-like n=1 Tax=Phoenix dactylifera TaxID=42345 RepID=A0A8B8ZG62_PHODC|nr:terpene synthase 10-like [Phoenix dactylifera]
MALHLGLSPLTINLAHPHRRLASFTTPRSCHVAHKIPCATTERRSANFQPSLWDYKFIQSLRGSQKSYYLYPFIVQDDAKNAQRIEKLKEVRNLIDEEALVRQLELIDALQQLGIEYHFDKEIKDILATTFASLENISMMLSENLYATALLFRVLREHGFHVSQDIFRSFKDEKGRFKAYLCKETKDILSLYQISYYALEGETTLDEARDFTTKHLKNLNANLLDEPYLQEDVAHALELPLNRRMRRLHTRWFIDAYKEEDSMHPVLLELAMLDFNAVQATYQSEFKEGSKWWNDLGLAIKLSFARDRLMECYYWSIGWAFEPRFGFYRRTATRVNCFISAVDDIYDVYGTLDELELFTNAVERWDVSAMEQLPDYMKPCFLAFINTTNETAYYVLKEKGIDVIPCLRKQWADLCKSFLVEAKWYHSGYTPTFKEYLDNAWISSSAPVTLTHAYVCVSQEITQEGLECIMSYPDIVQSTAKIFRLCDDLAGSKEELERGDVSSAIQCYMHDEGVSESVAREHIRGMIDAFWKELNGDRFTNSPFEESFIVTAMNVARMVECIYQYGDGYSMPDRETKDRIKLLLIDPIQFN